MFLVLCLVRDLELLNGEGNGFRVVNYYICIKSVLADRVGKND